MANKKIAYIMIAVFFLLFLLPTEIHEEADYEVTEMSAQGRVFSEILNVRSGPGTGCRVLGITAKGDMVTVTGQGDGWYRINYEGSDGFVSGNHLEITQETYIGKTSQIDAELVKLAVILAVIAVALVSSQYFTDCQQHP